MSATTIASAEERNDSRLLQVLARQKKKGDELGVYLRDARRVYVNGTRYEVESDTIIAIEDEAETMGDDSRLRLGMKVRVTGTDSGGQRSALAAKVLHDLGYHNVAHLEVGFNGWAAAGGATEPDAPNPKYFQQP